MLNETLWAQMPANDNATPLSAEPCRRPAVGMVSANDNAGLVCATRRGSVTGATGSVRVCGSGAAMRGAREVGA